MKVTHSSILFERVQLRTPQLLGLAFAVFSLTASANAQSNFGAVVGSVTDASGAIVPGASVTVKNEGTNATVVVKTGGGGTYSLLNLNPGAYTVTVALPGFKSATREHVDVTIGGTARVDVPLSPGEVSEIVNVEASNTSIQTDTTNLGGVVEGAQVEQSPLNGRNVNNLLDFIPGVVAGGGTSGNTLANGGSGSFQAGAQTQAIAYGNYQIGGGFSGQSLFYIDGVSSNVPENNVNSLVPTQDSVQEFRVQSNNVTAEFGGFSGGVIQISTKSGTNTFHGTAYEYFRNTALDANDYFSNHAGLARTPLHQNQFGGNLGGPVFRNKAFFFFSFERETLSSGAISTYTLPTAAELGGDFSALGTNIYNPATGVQYSCNGRANVICANQLDATAVKILQLESPLPNRAGLVNNFVATAPITGNQNQYNARVDYNLGSRDQIFAKYVFWNPHNGNSDPLGTGVGAGGTGNTTTEVVLGENHTFNATTIGDLRASWLENYNYQFPLSNGFNQSQINANYGALQAQQVNNHQGLLPGLGIQGYSVGAGLSQLYWLNTAYSLSGSLTKTVGRHTIKVGGAARQVEWTGFGNNQGVSLNALPSFTASAAVPGSGNALASFLLGTPSSVSINEVGTFRAILHPYGFYAIDTFQATKNLTVNLGLRWDQPSAYTERDNNNTVLQPNATCALANCTIANPVTGQNQTLHGNLAFVASPQYGSRREEDLHYKLFSPRVGIANRVNDKTVLRAGYGISFLPAELTADSPGGSPINSATTAFTNTPGIASANTVANPFPGGILLPSQRNPAGLTALLGQSIGSRVPSQHYGYVQQYNLGVETALDSKSTLSVFYAGAKGTHLVISSSYTGTGLNLNQIPDQYLPGGSAGIVSTPASGTAGTAGYRAATGLYAVKANPLYPAIKTGGLLGSPTILEGNLLQPYPQYQAVNQVTPRFGFSNYNALQVAFTRRFNHGGLVQLAYTYAKLMSNTDNTSSFEDGQGGHGVVQDNTNLAAEYSLSEQDLTHNLVINYGADLPFGRNQRYLNHSNALVQTLAGGWRLNGITTLHSGLPIPFIAAANTLSSAFGGGTYGIIRPNVVPGCNKLRGGPAQSRATQWFTTACFTQPGDLSFGTERRVDTVRTAGAANFDVSATKQFPLYERFNGQFTVQAFNIFNRAQFGTPDSNVADGAFGTVAAQANLPRVLQFALRISF